MPCCSKLVDEEGEGGMGGKEIGTLHYFKFGAKYLNHKNAPRILLLYLSVWPMVNVSHGLPVKFLSI